MTMKTAFATAALAAVCVLPALARADVVEHVTMDFSSGATFSGDVTMANDFSHYVSVTGTLSGGNYGNESFGYIWDTYNWSSGANNYSEWLMSSDSNFYIQLAINYANPNQLAFTTGVSYQGDDNFINYSDSMVSGSISAVPESGNLAMMMLGLGVIGALGRKARASAKQAAFA